MGDGSSKDLLNGLPDSLLCQILSKLSTKEAALTSLLSKRWRYLFTCSPNLAFDENSIIYPETTMIGPTSFIHFVYRVLDLGGEGHVNKFSLKCRVGIGRDNVFPWISNVLRRGISDLALHISPQEDYSLPSQIFESKTLVRLKIETHHALGIKLRNVYLPKLRTLHLNSVVFEGEEVEFAQLLSGCPLLEELILHNLGWENWDYCPFSSKTLKRLMVFYQFDENPKSVLFDTPNVVYLDYSVCIANKYQKVNLDSLVEASFHLQMTNDQRANAMRILYDDEERDMVGNATNLIMGICNVQTLYLSANTLEILTFCCTAIPVFNNLTRLTIESKPEVGWESLPDLLKNCPNLETLVFEGLLHKTTNKCGDVCLCQGLEKNPTCLSSSRVRFLKIMKFGETGKDVEMETKQVVHLLEKMPNIESLTIHYNTPIVACVVRLSSRLLMLAEVASLKIKIQVISDNITLSHTFPISLSAKFG